MDGDFVFTSVYCLLCAVRCVWWLLFVRLRQMLGRLVEAATKLSIDAQESQFGVATELRDVGLRHASEVRDQVTANELAAEAEVVSLSSSAQVGQLRQKIGSGRDKVKADATG